MRLAIITALLGAATGLAKPDKLNPQSMASKPRARIEVFGAGDCTSVYPYLVSLRSNDCFAFQGAKGIKAHDHTDDLKYNALRVYKNDKCSGGWTLQPLGQTWCSDVSTFESMQLVDE